MRARISRRVLLHSMVLALAGSVIGVPGAQARAPTPPPPDPAERDVCRYEAIAGPAAMWSALDPCAGPMPAGSGPSLPSSPASPPGPIPDMLGCDGLLAGVFESDRCPAWCSPDALGGLGCTRRHRARRETPMGALLTMERLERKYPGRSTRLPVQMGRVLLPPEAVPERWAPRADHVALVRLLPGEVHGILGEGTTAPDVDPEEEPLLRLVARGASIRDIATELDMSRRSVERRLGDLRRRFGARSKSELSSLLSLMGFGTSAPWTDGGSRGSGDD